MSRLIDADEFQKQIVGTTILNNYPPGKANALCKLVDSQPTAFDVEKVIEELENLREVELRKPDMCDELGDGDADAQYNDGVSQGRYEAFIEAIKIVKRGGRND